MPSPASYIRPLVRAMHAYVPGEQPAIPGLIKLNTNENPYPPSARVLRAVKAAVDGRLRRYPNPTAGPLRRRLARLHGCTSRHVLVGNGADECLALTVRAFVEPRGASRRHRPDARSIVQYLIPSYSLYPVLADAHGADKVAVLLGTDFALPSVRELRREGHWRFDAALTFITTPNAPTGRGYRTADLESICRAQRGLVVLDEAYVDFADDSALSLALKLPHVLVARTFSKAYSLCALRVGYVVGHPTVVKALDTVRDSYNVNGLGQVAAMATLDDLPVYRARCRRIVRTRRALARALTSLGFEVCDSQTNFLFVRPPRYSARTWLQKLRAQKVLVRWFSALDVREYLRITVGTDAEMKTLVAAVKHVLGA